MPQWTVLRPFHQPNQLDLGAAHYSSCKSRQLRYEGANSCEGGSAASVLSTRLWPGVHHEVPPRSRSCGGWAQERRGEVAAISWRPASTLTAARRNAAPPGQTQRQAKRIAAVAGASAPGAERVAAGSERRAGDAGEGEGARGGKGKGVGAGEAEGVGEVGRPLPVPRFTVVMKFGGTSVAGAERMREVAALVASFPEERPVLVLSAMARVTNALIAAGEKAVQLSGPASGVQHLSELIFIREAHLKAAEELEVGTAVVSDLLYELQQLLTGLALMRELTPRTRDYLVSFGERMSTRLFAAFLCQQGVEAVQYDAHDIGFISTDEFTNAELLEDTYAAVEQRLHAESEGREAIPVVTGFIARGQRTGAITTLGRGGSDLTAAALGRALGVREVQVWKDVDGVLSADPRIVPRASVVPFLTYDEAAELAYFGAQVLHPQAMRPAREACVPVHVKNSYNREAKGTLIMGERDMTNALLTSIVCKQNVTMVDIVSTRMLGQYGFLARVFSILEEQGISVDVVATSEVSVSLTLDPAKIWDRELIDRELEVVVSALEKVATVRLLRKRSIISLIGNVAKSSTILEKVFQVLRAENANVQMISQGASKVNISLIVNDAEAHQCVRVLHAAFFES